MKLREIERLRATAILMVMVIHWPPLGRFLPPVARESWSGVDLFFVISGYVVSLSLLRMMPPLEAEPSFAGALGRASESIRAFYVRRFFRIMPAALTVMIVFRALAGVIPQKYGPTGVWWTELVTFFGGIYNYSHPFRHDLKLGVYWSLAVEEHFYLVLPILFVVFRTSRRRVAACAAVALVSAGARFLGPPHVAMQVPEYYERLSSHLRFDSLMAGVVLAFARTRLSRGPGVPRALVRWAVVPAAIALIACLPSLLSQAVMERFGFIALWMLSGVLVHYAGQDRGCVLEVPGLRRVLEYLGSRSYALYLVHVGVGRFEDAERHHFPAYMRLVPDGNAPVARVAVVLAASLLVAEALHRAVERPMMRLGKRLVEHPGSTVELPASTRRLAMGAAGLLLVVWFRHSIMLSLGPANLARGATVVASSHMEGKPGPEALTNGELEPRFGLHTAHEDAPWATIDLGARLPVGAVRVYNRDDGYQDDDLPMELQVSDDDASYRTLARRTETFTQQWPWRVRTDGVRARFVRLRLEKAAALCLSEVEVFEDPAMADVP